jgi:hypothetical protein
MDESNGMWKPPYFAFQTFWTFMADLSSKPLPPKIDRSLLKSKSGTDQMNLLFALRAFDLVDDQQAVNVENLVPIAQGDEETRAKALGDLVRRWYPKALDLSAQSGTEGQLNDLFRDEYGLGSADTRRKAVTFFLHAARRADIELSQHFPNTRSGSGGPGSPRAKRAPGVKRPRPNGTGTAAAPVVTTEQTAGGECKHVTFGEAGTVTVTVDVKWLDLPDHVFTGLRKVIRDLEALGSPTDSPPATAAGAPSADEEV